MKPNKQTKPQPKPAPAKAAPAKPKPQPILARLEPGDGINLGADGRCLVLEVKTHGGDRVVCGALDSPVLVVLESAFVPAHWIEKRFGPEAVETWKGKYGNVDEDTGQLNNKVRVGGIKEKRSKPSQPAGDAPVAPKAGSNTGRLGGYMGFSVATVIRTLGKAGWNKDEVTEFLKSQEIEASPASIAGGIKNGLKGKKSVADFTPEFMASIRPKPAQSDLPFKAPRRKK